jgi:hypothetical protein
MFSMRNSHFTRNKQASSEVILLANPYEPDDKEREKQAKEENQVKDRRKENIDVTETTSSLSSASRNRPSRTSSLPEGEYLHADARRVGKHLHR